MLILLLNKYLPHLVPSFILDFIAVLLPANTNTSILAFRPVLGVGVQT